ncbi:hypothetical protein [Ekhidna sp.]|uniref:hypothetical protein n=1 Tax=Ekhidna sp. TaxID=2608089 RepID=UPI0032EED177
MENLSSIWWESGRILLTRLSGEVTIRDIEHWERSLIEAYNQINDHEIFKIFINLFGFKAIDLEAHKRYRSTIPLVLSKYGWRVGYPDMFEEANNLKLSTIRGIRCVGAAHIHQDASKIEKYQELYAHNREQYFTDPDKGYAWIEELSLGG